MILGVAILAAGASARMGRPKLLLPWGTGTVLAHLLEQWRQIAPGQIAVVCAKGPSPVAIELDRLKWPDDQRILNPAAEHGMFSSVQCAAAWGGWKPDLTHWAVALGDQPLVQLQTLRDLLEFARSHPTQVCQPSRQGRGRHPVVLPAAAFALLRTSTAENLKQFLLTTGQSVARCELNDPGLDLDLDVPADYERALAEAHLRESR